MQHRASLVAAAGLSLKAQQAAAWLRPISRSLGPSALVQLATRRPPPTHAAAGAPPAVGTGGRHLRRQTIVTERSTEAPEATATASSMLPAPQSDGRTSQAAEGPSGDAIMSDSPLVARLEEQCAAIHGDDWDESLGLEQLFNPATVVNLELELEALRANLTALMDLTATPAKMNQPRHAAASSSSPASFSALPVVTSTPSTADELAAEIAAKEARQRTEMRGVMRDGLKAVFVLQSLASIVVCGFVSYDAVPFFPDLELYVRVLGFWGVWLFTIPSLRSRKPGGAWGMSREEKRALDAAFLLAPVANLATPAVSKDFPVLFWVNMAVLGSCYAWFLVGPGSKVRNDYKGTRQREPKEELPELAQFALQALDFGSGGERGLSKTARERLAEREVRRRATPGALKDGERTSGGSGDVIPG